MAQTIYAVYRIDTMEPDYSSFVGVFSQLDDACYDILSKTLYHLHNDKLWHNVSYSIINGKTICEYSNEVTNDEYNDSLDKIKNDMEIWHLNTVIYRIAKTQIIK